MKEAPRTGSPDISVAEEPEALDPVLAAWDDLAVAAARPYCTPAWMLGWWRHAAPRRSSLRVVTVVEGERLLGVAPFFAERTPTGLTRYRVLGAGTSSQVDLLAIPGEEPVVAAAIGEALAAVRPAPDVIVFEGIPASSPWPEALARSWPGRRPTTHVLLSQPAPYLVIDEGFDAWFASRSSHYRARMRRGLRKLAARGAGIRMADGDHLSGDLASFTALHRRRWEKRGGTGVLTPQVEAMLAGIAPGLLAAGRLRLWMVEAEGKPVSAQMFLVAGGEASYWLGGFDEAWSDLHPGPSILTVLKAIEHAAGQGDRRIDLGAGEQAYKYEFAGAEDALEWTIVALPTLRYPLSRMQMLPLRTRLTAARLLTPGTKKKLRAWRARLPARSRQSGGETTSSRHR